MKALWLRREDKPGEWRVPLTPEGVRELLSAGVPVTVERSEHRVFDDTEYEVAGALMTEQHWWQAPPDAVVIGLKELAEATMPIAHTHIYFSHTYKGQEGAAQVLQRYAEGGGRIFDLEFLQDNSGRRIAAFGYWAGYVGAALGMMGLAHYSQSDSPFPAVERFRDRKHLIDTVDSYMKGQHSRVMVMGALGRCGTGAIELLKSLSAPIDISAWDIAEYNAADKPIREITEHDVFINCVYLQEKIRPMIDPDLLKQNVQLRIISDVSCDPNNPNNPIAVYDAVTYLDAPFRRAAGSGEHAVFVQAIDHLPTLLPREASEEFAAALLPHLNQFLSEEQLPSVWQNALDNFRAAQRLNGVVSS